MEEYMYGCTVLKKPEYISDQKYFMDVFVLILLDSIEAKFSTYI